MKINRRLLERYCSLVTILTPFLMMYYVGLSTTTFLDVAILLGYAGILCTEKTSLRIDEFKLAIIVFCGYIFVNYCTNIFFQTFSVFGVLLRTVRFLVYLSWPVLICGKFFDEKFTFTCYKYICIFATGFLLLQYIFLKFLNISLPGYIPFFTLSRPELKEFTESLYMSSFARPRSIFAEPSQFGIYVTGYLCIQLLKNKKSFHIPLYLFLAFGLMLSGSTTSYFGLGLSLLIIACNFFKSIKFRIPLKRVLWYWSGLVLVLLAVFTQFNRIIAIVDKAIVRMPTSFRNRLGGYKLLNDFFTDQPLFSILFGIGMDVDVLNNVVWTSSIVKIVFYFGIVGTGLLIGIIIMGIFKLEVPNRRLLLIIVFLGFFTEVLVSSWLVLFLPFMYSCERHNMIFYKKEYVPEPVQCQNN